MPATSPAPLRTRVAALAGRVVSEVSRRAGLGEGSVIGGRVTLVVDPGALARLAAGHCCWVVSGTNGKTTTTRLLAAAVSRAGPVVTNASGANLPSGVVSALSSAPPSATAVLEVDEGLLPSVTEATRPEGVVLLNLSRDQLDRVGEVRTHAQRWARALDGLPSASVVANADDPLVVWAARQAPAVTWVGTGQRWWLDAAACPSCGGRIEWEDGTWGCPSCGLVRPDPSWTLDGETLVAPGGVSLTVRLSLPGWANRANAAMATAAAAAIGLDPAEALGAMAEVRDVAGRYQVMRVGTTGVRLLLAKNPAGWAEALDLLQPAPTPVVVGINARIADGRDPSWLWDVAFERLAKRPVVATGERGRDLAVRLRYAGVDHVFVRDELSAVRHAVAGAGAAQLEDVDVVANYTSFQVIRTALARGDHG